MSIGGAALPQPPDHEAGQEHQSHEGTSLQVRLKVTCRKAFERRAMAEAAHDLRNSHAKHPAGEIPDDRERKRHQIAPPARRPIVVVLRLSHAQYAASRRATETMSATCGST